MRHNLLYNENSLLKRELDQMLCRESETNVSYVPVEELEEITPETFQADYVAQQKPLVIRGGAKHWPATNKWNFGFFADAYGDVEVVANLYDIKAKRALTLKQLASILSEKKYKSPTYLQEWWFQESCPQLLDDVIIPEHFAGDYNKKLLGYYNNTLWIGQKGAYTPLHQDTAYANVWSAQLMGSKEWVLIDKNARIEATTNDQPDYDRFFAESKGQIFKTTLQQGDILYMPHKWWHRAETLEHAISFNTFHISEEIVQRYLKDMFRIPYAALLNKELLQQYDPMRYNICLQRSETFAKLFGFNIENILEVDTSGQAAEGIYSKKVSNA